jgi:branched-chain amino acid transport system substrate-binding protein
MEFNPMQATFVKRRLAAAVESSALAVAIAASLAACSPKSDDVVVKIGHVAPISGPQAHQGKDNENAAKMAIEDLNAAGVKLGGKKVKFELVAEDDAADPKQGAAAAQKLVDAKVNGVIGHLNSGTTIPASTIYKDAGIPQISPSATNPKYTLQGYKTAFRVVANDGQLGSVLGKYAVDELKAKKVAIIDDKTAYGEGVAAEFKKSVVAHGAQIVATEHTTDRSTDFQSILTTVKGANPDIVFYGGMDSQAGPMLRQMKQLGIKAKFVGGDGICSTGLVKLAGESLADDEVVCAEAGGVEEGKKKRVDDFRARYKDKYKLDVELYAPYVYDAVMVMAEAMKKADSADPAKYLPALAAIDYDGVTGRIVFDPHGDIKDGALTLYTYRHGAREQIAVVK